MQQIRYKGIKRELNLFETQELLLKRNKSVIEIKDDLRKKEQKNRHTHQEGVIFQ